MKKILNKTVKFGQYFGAGLALHCIGDNPDKLPLIAGILGLQKDVAKGVFSLGNDILKHYLFDSWKETTDSFKGDVNNDLENAIINAYKESLSKIESDVIEEYEVKEKISKKFLRYIFNKENEEYEAQFDLRVNFISPLLRNLTDDKEIGKMLAGNEQLHPDELLKSIVKKAKPDYADISNEYSTKFVDDVCEKFKKYYSHYFLQELKKNDKAKTVYFTHLLESIILETKNITKDLPLLIEFASQSNLKLTDLLKGFSIINTNVEELRMALERHQTEISDKLASIQGSLKDLINPFLDKRDRSQYQDQFNKYDFKYGYLDFVGRNEELSRLLNFIGTKTDKTNFSWWLVTGPGGMGKSRIAQKLCMMKDGYYSGFLDINSNTKWESWKPEMPTFIVIDYALSDTAKVHHLIKTLSQRSSNKLYSHPVRLLLLEREETETWKQLLRPGTEIYDTLYREIEISTLTRLDLKPLESEYRWRIVEQVIKQENEIKWNEIKSQKTAIILKLEELDNKNRPLFTFLVSMALAFGENIRYWNTNDLLRNTLLRFEDLLSKYMDSDKKGNVKYFLLINTLCGELDKKTLNNVLNILYKEITYGQFKNYYLFASEYKNDNDNDLWFGIQPDILGEYFIIKTINEIIDNQPSTGAKFIKDLISISLHINSANVIHICHLIWLDFQFGNHRIPIQFDIINYLYEEIIVSENREEKKQLALLFGFKAAKHCELEDYVNAEIDAEIALKLNKEDRVSYNNMGIIKTELKKYEEATIYFEKALELSDGLVAVYYYNFSTVKRELKLYKESIEFLDKAIKLNPHHAKSFNDRGLAKYYLGEFEEALLDLNTSLAIEISMNAYNNRGLVEHAKKNYDKSLLDYANAINLNDKYDMAYFNRALLYREIKFFEKALLDTNMAISLNNKDSDFFKLRGYILLEMGDKISGLADLRKAEKMGNESAKVFLYEALNYKVAEKNSTFNRNDRVSVKYFDGSEVFNIKYKEVAKDVELNKCIIIAYHPK